MPDELDPTAWPRSSEDVGSELASLWSQWAQQRELEARNRLLVHYSPLVRYVVARIASGMPPHIDFADLVSTGVFGLIDALDKYASDRGVPFEAYAMMRIRGAVLDDLRAQDWVPRSARDRQRQVDLARQTLYGELGRLPTTEELSSATGLTAEQVVAALQQQWFSVVESLDEVVHSDDESVSRTESIADPDVLDPELAVARQEAHARLLSAVDVLPDREARVIRLYYGDTLSLRQIGDILGVTESRASQLRSRAIEQLRAALAEHNGHAA